MTLSSACQDIVRALVFMASQNELISVKTISDELKIPFHFLSKHMQTVAKAGLVYSKRGVDGGVRLAKPAETITILDIINVIDGDKYFDKCLLGFAHCDLGSPCVLHAKWEVKKNEMIAIFATLTLRDITNDLKTKPSFKI